MADDFERAKAYLKQSNLSGQSLYDHLTDVLMKVVKEKPEDALSAFESLSLSVKQAHLAPPQYKEIPSVASDAESKLRILASLDQQTAAIKPKDQDEDDDGGEGGAQVPDLLAQAELFESAGVNLGRDEIYKISLSLDQLAKTENFESVRFFGKVFGTQKDYLLVEAKLAEWPEDQEEKDDEDKTEGWGIGANQYAYYVTNSLEQKWTRLPLVTPDHIIASRNMRRAFTGDLSAPVLGFPRFPWGEASYLRAQLARIAAATTISPKGFYSLDEEEEEPAMVEDEEFEGASVEELLTSEGWAHHRNGLLKQGRTTPYVAPEKDDEDEEDEDKKEDEEEQEEPIPLLSSLDNDSGDIPELWTFRVSPRVDFPHAVVSCHSLSWPGAVSVAKKKLFANIYIGNGHKYLPGPYTPPPPPSIQAEFVPEFNPEEDEPNPLQEQADPLPPPDLPEEKEDGEGEDGEGEDGGDDDGGDEDDE